MKLEPIYLDYNATTPIDTRVGKIMISCSERIFGNPNSVHLYGQEASEIIDEARKKVSLVINAKKKPEIIFTSGATESNNLALQGLVYHLSSSNKNHVITSSIEHKSILEVLSALEKRGFDVTYISPRQDGVIDVENIRSALRKNTGLISIMHANNETGVINPIKEIGEIAVLNNTLFHCDAAQSFGKIPVDVQEMNIHLLSISAHKIYGPKGIGALYVRKNDPEINLQPIMYGGGQEQGLRPGTLPTSLIVGFGEAATIAKNEMSGEAVRLENLRNRLLVGLQKNCEDIVVNGSLDSRLSNNLNISFLRIDSDALINNLRNELAISNGSACTSSNWESSYVLKAIGISEELARGAVRIGLGRFTTDEEINLAINYISETVRKLRRMITQN